MGKHIKDGKIGCAKMLLNAMENVERPILMYQVEKDVIKEALTIYIELKEIIAKYDSL